MLYLWKTVWGYLQKGAWPNLPTLGTSNIPESQGQRFEWVYRLHINQVFTPLSSHKKQIYQPPTQPEAWGVHSVAFRGAGDQWKGPRVHNHDLSVSLGLFSRIPGYQTSFRWKFLPFGRYLSSSFQYLTSKKLWYRRQMFSLTHQ